MARRARCARPPQHDSSALLHPVRGHGGTLGTVARKSRDGVPCVLFRVAEHRPRRPRRSAKCAPCVRNVLPARWRTRTCRACGAACARRNGAASRRRVASREPTKECNDLDRHRCTSTRTILRAMGQRVPSRRGIQRRLRGSTQLRPRVAPRVLREQRGPACRVTRPADQVAHRWGSRSASGPARTRRECEPLAGSAFRNPR